MVARKIQSEDEVKRWYEQGRTIDWMAEQYGRKYNIEITPTAFHALITRRGWANRRPRYDEHLPWKLPKEHRFLREADALRQIAKRERGVKLTPTRERLANWLLEQLRDMNAVVHYDPELDPPFVLVPREPSDGDLLVRMPKDAKKGL